MAQAEAKGDLNRIRGQYRLKRQSQEIGSLKTKAGVCVVCAAAGVLVVVGTLYFTHFAGARMRMPSILALALMAGMWLYHLGGLTALVGVGTTWTSFWTMQAVAFNKRRRVMEADLFNKQTAVDSDFDPEDGSLQQPGPDASQPGRTESRTLEEASRFKSIELPEAGVRMVVPGDWTREQVDGVTVFLAADGTGSWPLNLQVETEPLTDEGGSYQERLTELVTSFQLTKEGFRLEGQQLIPESEGGPAGSFSFTHTDGDTALWTRVHVRWSEDKASTLSTTVQGSDRHLMETIFEEAAARFRLGAAAA